MCMGSPSIPPPPPAPPALPEQAAVGGAQAVPGVQEAQNLAARLGTSSLTIPFNTVNIPG